MFRAGGERWKRWNETLRPAVVGSQRGTGDEKGSWDPAGPEGRTLGRVGVTALLAVTMTTYYRYARGVAVEAR